MKKKYVPPAIAVIPLAAQRLLAASSQGHDTGDTGDDEAKRHNGSYSYDDDYWHEFPKPNGLW